MLKYWLNTNTRLNAVPVMKATQYLCSVRPVQQMHLSSAICHGHWLRSWRAFVGCGQWVIS